MRITIVTLALVWTLFVGACSAKGDNQTATLEATEATVPDSTTAPRAEAPRQLSATDIQLTQMLDYNEHTLDDTYPYKDTTRSFQWDKIKEKLALVENMQASPERWLVFQNYRNQNGEAPTVKDYVRDEYKRVADRNGVARYQSAPLYTLTDTTTVVLYARDGWLAHLTDSVGSFYKVRPIEGDEQYLTPKKYTLLLAPNARFTHVAVVDRANQNICTLLFKEEGNWTVTSKNPATTGLKRPPYKQETPLGVYLIQQKKAKMFYTHDGTTEIAGFAPWANRFCCGAYIHGIPLNRKEGTPAEYSPSLGTTPRSHMCVRNATSHAKYVYDNFPTLSSLVVVIE